MKFMTDALAIDEQKLIGYAMNNASFMSSQDCISFDCHQNDEWCHVFDLTQTHAIITPQIGVWGTEGIETRCEDIADSGRLRQAVYIWIEPNQTINLTSVTVSIINPNNRQYSYVMLLGSVVASEGTTGATSLVMTNSSPPASYLFFDFTSPPWGETPNNDCTNQLTITSIRLTGTGNNPFGDDNC
jgi:hypothetical protein